MLRAPILLRHACASGDGTHASCAYCCAKLYSTEGKHPGHIKQCPGCDSLIHVKCLEREMSAGRGACLLCARPVPGYKLSAKQYDYKLECWPTSDRMDELLERENDPSYELPTCTARSSAKRNINARRAANVPPRRSSRAHKEPRRLVIFRTARGLTLGFK